MLGRWEVAAPYGGQHLMGAVPRRIAARWTDIALVFFKVANLNI